MSTVLVKTTNMKEIKSIARGVQMDQFDISVQYS
jgi:hypothetical protein